MRIMLHIGISVLATVALYILYSSGNEIASYFGYSQRGGVGWGISVFYASFFMLPSAFISMLLLNKLKISSIVAAAIGFLIFVSLSTLLVGNQFSGNWSHPYRYIYFQFCALLVFASLVVAQLTSKGIGRDKAAPML